MLLLTPYVVKELHINAINANAIPCSQGNVGHHLYISFAILNGQIGELRVRKSKLNMHKITVYGEVMRSYTPYTQALYGLNLSL